MPCRTAIIGPCPAATESAARSAEKPSADEHPDVMEATQASVHEQDKLGIDILDEGGLHRRHPVFDTLRHLRGVEVPDVRALERDEGDEEKEVPLARLRRPIAPGHRYLRHDWRAAQEATHRPVQLALPGPLTLAGFIEDEVYGDERALCAALGDALNHEIRDLAAAGCPWIRIDEPRFLTAPEWAVAFGVDNLARCFHRVPKGVTRFVHLPRAAPAALDEPDSQGSEDTGYAAIAEALADAPIDAVALADARRANDLSLLEAFTATTVVLGVLDVAASNLETVDAIRDRLRAALDHIDPHRLMAGPDAALDLLPATLARDKLKTMVAAARAV
ncbi:hypothetical protein [Ferruginivarius sediminum]|uniref:Cobalamin-independent methionine synthase MetE C-terminal/archaeal domain-containing protein n=1 Tax=Ferruginivarius sediminum TaxID=2661937 RepID=A0A369T4U2_9PROT|nr:hypothetical protein [Ferruginivarius sediminum]RDD60361.1 hypothetical protein DRB17_18550 [Ferruginivarius sediminum]